MSMLAYVHMRMHKNPVTGEYAKNELTDWQKKQFEYMSDVLMEAKK
jgi:hypothetical protein